MEEDWHCLSLLMKLMSENNSKLVFHNGSLDLMHLWQHFIEDLPFHVDDFKSKVNSMFPHIYDSKQLVN